MTDYLVCATQADADAALAAINDAMGFTDTRTMTNTWAIARQRATDGKWVFAAPPVEWRDVITVPYTVEASQPDWFPTPE